LSRTRVDSSEMRRGWRPSGTPPPGPSSVPMTGPTQAAHPGGSRGSAHRERSNPPGGVPGSAHHDGVAAYRDRFEWVLRRESAHPNDVWQADHIDLNVMILDPAARPARPWLTVMLEAPALSRIEPVHGSTVPCRRWRHRSGDSGPAHACSQHRSPTCPGADRRCHLHRHGCRRCQEPSAGALFP